MIRTLLVVAVGLLFLLAVWGLRVGWRHRLERQSDLPAPPEAPAELGRELIPASTGLYVGSAFASSWQDRVVAGGLGLRAAGTAALYEAGAVFERDGAEPVFVPTSSIREARLAAGLAGKVVGSGGLLVLRWRLGENEIDTAFRADDTSGYPRWARLVNDRVSAA